MQVGVDLTPHPLTTSALVARLVRSALAVEGFGQLHGRQTFPDTLRPGEEIRRRDALLPEMRLQERDRPRLSVDIRPSHLNE